MRLVVQTRRMRDFRPSVWARAIVFIVVVSSSLLGLDLRQCWITRGERLHQAVTETDNLARSLAQHVQDVFGTTDVILKALIDANSVAGSDPAAIQRIDKWMRVNVVNQALFHGLFQFNENGNWIASSLDAADFAAVREVNYADRDFFRYHRDHDDNLALIGPPIRARLDDALVVTMSRRLNHPDGGFAGVVVAAISVDQFQRFFGTFDLGRLGSITLVNGQGILLVRRPFEEQNVGRSVADGAFFRQTQGPAGSGSVLFTSLLDAKSRLGSFQRVKGFDLVVMVTRTTDDVLAQWWQDTRIHFVWLAGAVGLVLILGCRLTMQIRDRVAAEAIAGRLQLESDQQRKYEAERRTYEHAFQRQRQELVCSNADLEQFAYAASHDLQAPLRAISHLSQWIEEDVKPTASAETLANLKLLNGRVARLQMLVRGLLAYARMGNADLAAEDVDVAATVRNVVASLSLRSSFVVCCEAGMPVIRTHLRPFAMILTNLISNAQQHHDRAEGQVVVAMRLLDKDLAEFRVSDDGPGIEPRFQEQIFVMFKTLRSRDDTELAGIGLAMVKKQVTSNGGRIWVESAPPARGSTFAFTWQLVPM